MNNFFSPLSSPPRGERVWVRGQVKKVSPTRGGRKFETSLTGRIIPNTIHKDKKKIKK